MVIAIDGPAAAGKGTLARRLARHYGLRFLDTGLLYRAVAAKLLAEGHDPSNEKAAEKAANSLHDQDLIRPDLRQEAVGRAASQVAAKAPVRAALIAYQRAFAATPPGAVLDGRDIGTVICPEAKAKLFITASLAERARRRARELRAAGEKGIDLRVLNEMKERDARDSGRVIAPLVPAADAFVLDTTGLDPEEVFQRAVSFIDSKGG
jgi:cytidylate kinase